ncbi:radical SAM protein [Puia sp. P3]|uniref:radical SAM protein n=1 Tax=Puia sp. P3 TaxID=3423952 RepID=UPI003D67F01D
MASTSLIHTFQRYRTLKTDRISALPIVILMPHSACNCKCVMCDIWKGNNHLRQLREEDVERLLSTLGRLGTQQVLMSGGEALLNANFFRLCELLKSSGIRVTLLSTGLLLARHRDNLLSLVDDIIVSLDGDRLLHDQIRNIPGAFQKLRDGVRFDPCEEGGLPDNLPDGDPQAEFQAVAGDHPGSGGYGASADKFLAGGCDERGIQPQQSVG